MKEGILKLMYGMGVVMAVNIITPTGKYEKQVRFISAIMFTVLVMNVFCGLSGFGLWETLTDYAPGSASGDYDTAAVNDYIMEEYINSLSEDMKKRLSDSGDDITVEVSVVNDVSSPGYGEIKSVKIKNIRDEDKEKAENIINSFYGVEFSHISFYGKEE